MNGVFTGGRWARLLLAVGLALSVSAGIIGPAAAAAGPDQELAAKAPGAVYIMSNAVSGNAVAVFNRSADGTLAAAGTYSTGGAGNGGSLHSQGALVLSADARVLLGVSAGSNEVFSFAVRPNGLRLMSHLPSGGMLPTSVATNGKLVYVLNNGSSTLSGYWLDSRGKLSPIAGSTRALSTPAADGAQVSFDTTGRFVAVTERATNRISVFKAGDDGLLSGPSTFPATGAVPYGFAFDQRDHMVVSEAGATAVSSYGLDAQGMITPISGPLPSGGAAPCWIVITGSGKYAFVANAGAGNIKGFALAHDGALNPLAGAAAAGVAPVEMTITGNSQFLYVLESGSHAIGAFAVRADGSLTSLAGATGLMASAAGLAAR